MPPRDSDYRGRCAWLLFTAVYGLINANSKWQVLSYIILTSMGFRQTSQLPQLFALVREKCTVAVVARFVNYLLVAGLPATKNPMISAIKEKGDLVTIVHGPGHLRYFRLNLHQLNDFSTTVGGDDKLEVFSSSSISLRRGRRKLYTFLTSIDSK